MEKKLFNTESETMAQFDSYMMQPHQPANYLTYKCTFGPRLASVLVLAGSGL